ncbi:UcrQ family-domain-containing protein [Tricladium varicosporioides]|nr:UcrQ family-domain-containing protein [Hymenoscyphus varicosporioides]
MNYDPNPNVEPGSSPVLCWGHNRIPKQKGVITYSLASNSQRPLAGAMHNAIFNTARRVRGQWLYVAPPFIAAYFLLEWMEKKNKFLNSKEGRRLKELEEEGQG